MALLFPILNIMELEPPIFFIICRESICPTKMKSSIGKIHEMMNDASGDASFTICFENFAPDSYSLSVKPGSFTTPVLYMFSLFLSVNTI